MKRFFLVYFITLNFLLFGEQYIKINHSYLLNDNSLDKTEIILSFDDKGYLTNYLSIRHVLGEITKKEIKCNWKNGIYELSYDIKNDINANPKNFNFIYSYEKTSNGWKEYANGELINTYVHKYSPDLQIIQISYKNETSCLFEDKHNLINLYGTNYKLLNGFYIKSDLDLSANEKILIDVIDNESFIIRSFYEGRLNEYKIEYNYECKNDDLIEILYTLQFFDLPVELIPFIVVRNKLQYHSTSYLTEGDTTYEPEHMQYKDGLPWASGNGKGIGEVISIKEFENKNPSVIKLLNGYQDKNHPDYYEKNSRVKKIKITNTDTKKSKIINVKDTKKEQVFKISDLGKGSYFDIEILEVYKGTKYEDLCIQYMVLK